MQLAAQICTVTARGTEGVVQFNEPYEGFRFGVISGKSKGRIALMNAAEDGKLHTGTSVIVHKLEPSIDAHAVLEISAA